MDVECCTNSQLNSSAPLLFLSSSKHEYYIGEKVIITVILTNSTHRALVVNKRLQMIFDYKYREAYELRFQITGPSNIPITPRRVIEDRLWPYPRSNDFAELLPGDQWQQKVTLSAYFDFSQAGVYQIVAEYHNDHNGHQFGLNAWTGELRSPPLEVHINQQ